MDISDLRIFTAVVREGGITRAAEHLHRVQSNVTTRIRQLEDNLGVPLFTRENRRLNLTPAGKTLLGYADKLLALAAEAEAAVKDTRPRGTLRLGAMDSTAAVRLPAPLAAYTRRFPNVEIELRTGNPMELTEAILTGNIDAALIAEPVSDDRFDSLPAFEEEPVIVTAVDHPPLKSGNHIPKAIIVFERGCPHRQRLEAWYARQGAAPDRTIELGSYHAMLGCVMAGMGAALLPKSVLSTFPDTDRIRVHHLDRQHASLKTLLIWRKGLRAPNVRALADILAGDEEFKDQ